MDNKELIISPPKAPKRTRRTMVCCVLLGLLLTGSVSGYQWHGIRIKDGGPDFDGWSIGHMAGGIVSYGGFRMLKVKPIYAVLGTVAAGYAYEIYKDGLGNKIPFTGGRDHRGADLNGDPIWVAVGGCVGVLLEASFKIIKLSEQKKVAAFISPCQFVVQVQI